MAEGRPHKRKPSPVAVLALIGGLVGALQYLNSAAWAAYQGGMPFELVGAVGGGAILGALAGWLWLRLRGRSQNTRSH